MAREGKVSIVPMRDILKDARSRGYAVGCYNVVNLEMARGIIQAAEEERSPVILCHAEVHFPITPIEVIAPSILHLSRSARVPVSILLDHGLSIESVMRAIKNGFNAVMFDGSELPVEDNIQKTSQIVRIAHALDIDVEAEIGRVTRPKSGGACGEEEDAVVDDPSLYTDTEEASVFVERTGVDALAVAIGTAHGIYFREPKLDFDRLEKIRKNTNAFLVLHGGSGLSPETMRKATETGITKVNYYTGMALKAAEDLRALFKGTQDKIFYHDLVTASVKSFAEDARRTMRIFNSSGKA
jgi:fructose-bisphosphate aldolase, class II